MARPRKPSSGSKKTKGQRKEPVWQGDEVPIAVPTIRRKKTEEAPKKKRQPLIKDLGEDRPPPSVLGFTDAHVVKALRYAQDVVSGKIDACIYVKQACQRQLRDLEEFKNHPLYYFNEAMASRPCRFIECLPHIEGPLARLNEQGQPNTIDLEGWQCFFVTTIFGWRRKDTGGRRFRRAYVEVPRGNGKSALASGVGLYCMAEDGEEGAQVYSAATTRDQAKIVWGVAKKMMKKKPAFADRLGIQVNEHSLIKDSTNSFFLPLSREADNLDGLNVHCALIDELHAHKTREIHDVIETGCQKRLASLLFVITTAGSDTSGICYEVRTHVVKVLARSVPDETQFGIIYTIDDGDPWDNMRTWVKANPNWGVSVYPDAFVAVATKAMHTPAAQNAFKTKHLDVWVNADQAWMDMRAWDRCADPSLHPDQFRGDKCFGGLDAASVSDIVCHAKLFQRMQPTKRKRCSVCRRFEDEHDEVTDAMRKDDMPMPCEKFTPSDEQAFEPHYYGFLTSYLPEGTIEEARNSQYKGWAEEGRIKEIPGPVIDQNVVKSDIIDDHAAYHFVQYGYDEWQSEKLALELTQEQSMEMVKIPATTKSFSAPMKEWEKATRTGRFHHDGNPVWRWMASNCVCHHDANDNIFPRKERPENKIDGVVAFLMALARAMLAPPEEQCPYDENHGVRTL